MLVDREEESQRKGRGQTRREKSPHWQMGTYFGILATCFSSLVILHKTLSLSELHFLHLYNFWGDKS